MAFEISTGEQRRHIQESLGITELKLYDIVKVLKDWLQIQPHLPCDVDEKILRSFATGCKSVEKCKSKLILYFTSRTMCKALFENRDPAEPDPNSGCLVQFWMRQLTPEGARVFFSGFTEDPVKMNFRQKEACRSAVNILDYKIISDDCFTSSVIFVMDFKYVTPMFTTMVSPTVTQQIIKYVWKCSPYRVSKIIFFNAGGFIDQQVGKLLRPFLGKKLNDRIIITTKDHSILKQFIPEEMLPEDYGGQEPSCREQTSATKEHLLRYRSWFITEGRKGIDETKRPQGQRQAIDFCEFGAEGTFKSLIVD